MPIIAKEKLTKAIMTGDGWTNLTKRLDISEGELRKNLVNYWGCSSLVQVRSLIGARESVFNTGFKFQGFRWAKEATV